MKRLPLALTAVFLVAALVLGCAPKPATPPAPQTPPPAPVDPDARNLKVAVLSDARNLNPYMGMGSTETYITGFVYDTLLGYDEEKGELRPGLADTWTVLEGGKVLRFELNKQAKFSDGKPVTAEDAVFSFNFVKQARFPGFMAITANVIEAVLVDQYTLDLKLMAPQSGSLRLLGTTVSIVPKHIWEGIQSPLNFPNLQPVGSGPFKLAEKVDGQYMVLENRKEHHRHQYDLEKITLTVVRDETVGIMSLLAGKFDLLAWRVDPAVAEDVMKNPGQYPNVKVAAAPSSSTTTVMFNLRNEPYNDINFRKAISLLIDQDKLIKDLLLGFGRTQGPGLVAPTMFYYNDKFPAVKADPNAAKALLDQAGYKDATGDGWRETPKGDQLVVDILTVNVPPQINVAEYLVAELKKIGINAKFTPLTAEALRNRQMAPDFDVSLFNLSFSNPDMMFFYYHTSRGLITGGRVAGFNYGGHSDPNYDVISEAMRAELNRDRYVELLKQMQEHIAGVYYHVPVFTADVINMYRDDRFTGWYNQPERSVSNATTYRQLRPK
ncbi:MAG: peptide ABC transporter substrate-binding protein [Bacillota bacterium]